MLYCPMKVLSVVLKLAMLLAEPELRLASRSGERVLSRNACCRLKPQTMKATKATMAITGTRTSVAMTAECRRSPFISNIMKVELCCKSRSASNACLLAMQCVGVISLPCFSNRASQILGELAT